MIHLVFADRLVSTSDSRNQGLLVVWVEENQQWEQVCRSNFSAPDAACRQLGFPEGGQLVPAGLKPDTYFSTGSLRFQCSGVDGEILSDCTTYFDNFCSYDQTVWLSCEYGQDK